MGSKTNEQQKPAAVQGQQAQPVAVNADTQNLSTTMGDNKMPAGEVKPAQPVQPAGAAELAPMDQPVLAKPDFEGYNQSISELKKGLGVYEKAMETDDQRRKREKKEKSQRIVAAVSDGLRALSNLYFTTKYAPNMYNHEKDSLYTKVEERQEKLKKERQENRDKYLNYSMKIGGLLADKAKALRDYEALAAELQLKKDAAARAKAKDLREEALQPDRLREQTGKADEAEHKATIAKANAGHADELASAKVATEGAKQNSYNASAVKNSVAAEKQKAEMQDGKARGKSTIRLRDGKVYSYDNKKQGAITALLPKMVQKAQAAAQAYSAKGDTKNAMRYRNMARQLGEAKTKETQLAAVVANVWDFPSLDGEIRQIIGTGNNDYSAYKRNKGAGNAAGNKKDPTRLD